MMQQGTMSVMYHQCHNSTILDIAVNVNIMSYVWCFIKFTIFTEAKLFLIVIGILLSVKMQFRKVTHVLFDLDGLILGNILI